MLRITPIRQLGEKMERSDSGFGDCPQIPESPFPGTKHTSIGSSITTVASESHVEEQQRASTPGSTRSRTQQKHRTSTSQRTISRQSSISAHKPRSHTTSRRSSFIIRDPALQDPIAPQIPNLHRTKPYNRPETINPYHFHRRCQSLFDPSCNPGGSPSSKPATPLNSSVYISHAPDTTHDDILTIMQAPSPTIPPTTIDWTLPTTRRREYEKIEASTRGLRGLWRRFAPKRCHKHSRLAFYDGDPEKPEADSDAGSVRRYRINLDDETAELRTQEVGTIPDRGSHKKLKGWRCFGKAQHENVDGSSS
ncbi:MAG: hypothetical protein LQ337_007307 [Flavoplaca oasis]|nr:MAG: hypothetical protein LQ337_007307 [Flavoplaca oasis]